MSVQMDPAIKKRRFLVRAALIAVYACLIVIMFLTGKGHTILVDDKDIEGGSILAIDGVLVSVDGQEELELYAGDRDKASVAGQRHRVTVKSLDGAILAARTFRVPIGEEMLLLSIPKVVAGAEPFIEIFVPRDIPLSAGESVGNTNSFTSPDAVPLPGAEAPPAPPPL
jgi:hypothetical protein